MPADAPTAVSIITSALRKLSVLGAAESAPNAEDTQLGLDELNELIEQSNLRKRNAFFQRSQAFTFGTSKQSYTIGVSTNTPVPDFSVAGGERPARLEFAQLVLTNSTPNVFLPVSIIHVEQYQQITVPALSSQFPLSIYYRPDWPNGTIFPYPAFSTSTSYQLNLTWWNQLATIAISEITNNIIIPFGGRRWLALTLARNLYLSFPKKTDFEELKAQQREAEADFQAPNTPPPRIATSDGVGSGSGAFDWRSRSWQG